MEGKPLPEQLTVSVTNPGREITVQVPISQLEPATYTATLIDIEGKKVISQDEELLLAIHNQEGELLAEEAVTITSPHLAESRLIANLSLVDISSTSILVDDKIETTAKSDQKVTFKMVGSPGQSATVSVEGFAAISGLKLAEGKEGQYQGSYTVQSVDEVSNAKVTFSLGNYSNQSLQLSIDAKSTFYLQVAKGINFLSLPLKPQNPVYTRDMLENLNATLVIRYNYQDGYFQGYTKRFPENGFEIEGGQGYIINAKETQIVPFSGVAWENQPPENIPTAPSNLVEGNTWAFMVSVDPSSMTHLNFSVKNQRTGNLAGISKQEQHSAKQAIWADWSRQSVVEVGDLIEISIHDQYQQKVGTLDHQVFQSDIDQAYVDIQVQPSDILPGKTQLLTNYPNPFNPETWIPYQLNSDAAVSIQIYGVDGNLVRRLEMGYQSAGYYHSQSRSGYWDGKNNQGEQVVSGIYFYQLLAGDYTDTRKMVILK